MYFSRNLYYVPPTFWFAEFLCDVLAAPPQLAFHWSVLTTGQTIRLSHWSASGEPWRQGLTMQNVLLCTAVYRDWMMLGKLADSRKTVKATVHLIYLFIEQSKVFRKKPELYSGITGCIL
jgi:hypothetical protein